MICHPCQDAAAASLPHRGCANLTVTSPPQDGLPVAATSWCDCQHQAVRRPVSEFPELTAAIAVVADARSLATALR